MRPLNDKMIAYCQDWLSRTHVKAHQQYCKEMLGIKDAEIGKVPNPKYAKTRKTVGQKVFVASLGKTFESRQKASVALGHHKGYITQMLNKKVKDKYGIRII